jgi:hypothetical protein
MDALSTLPEGNLKNNLNNFVHETKVLWYELIYLTHHLGTENILDFGLSH